MQTMMKGFSAHPSQNPQVLHIYKTINESLSSTSKYAHRLQREEKTIKHWQTTMKMLYICLVMFYQLFYKILELIYMITGRS